jgi:hypothetical protein
VIHALAYWLGAVVLVVAGVNLASFFNLRRHHP